MKINSRGRDYWVEDHGDGPVLVLLHGFTGSASTFDVMLDHLSADYRLIKIDLPGHGKTGPLGVVTMEKFCHDFKRLLDQLDIEEITLLGYSLGGRAALSFTMLYPEYVKQLILESSSPGLETTEEQLTRQAKDKGLSEMIQRDGLEAFVSYWEKIPLFESHQALSQDVKRTLREERMSHSPEGLSDSLLGMGTGHQPSWWGQLSVLKLPVLLITGGWDEKFRKINQRMSELLPEVVWREVEGAGHTVHLEKPIIFAKIVDDFMIE
ncbi:2-succinyl-6-hydroxy-2,4-cyclohexadiene-1-carboxylate synthase [Halobacillus dabanensis]|uniref:Putative 2-succinyl-6-hydroxy-2,4-cyclohexadiene-1-carboxylate synthase n=1 Tax=Halobacillus dabanensis TaxID=240302 RepID=A0A1I3QYU3_HALDA|nr:2-succinyl-6-hydroxy-2,4-cyclohexadiene-1-carboxylate synthase [Halobacillus dabanensis]SFJ39354.1 2-succinyl-6-hydroxy-2,4-cyclohexadiene-1-carboxylate synthase [Halobacillus dabanensis]